METATVAELLSQVRARLEEAETARVERHASRSEALAAVREGLREKAAEAPQQRDPEELEALRAENARLREQLATLEETTQEAEAQPQNELEAELAELRAETERLRAALSGEEAGPKTQADPLAILQPGSHKQRIGALLVEAGVLDPAQLDFLLNAQADDPHRRLGALAVEHGYVAEEMVAQVLAVQLELDYAPPGKLEPSAEARRLVSPHLARLHRCIPLRKEDDQLRLAMANPLDLIAIEDIELASKHRVVPMVTTSEGIDQALAAHYAED